MKLSLMVLFTTIALTAYSQDLFKEGDSAATIFGKLIGVGLVIYVLVYFIWLRKRKKKV